jgi:outer membrane protein assembly factor BamD (BamD/ComL family)/TM2 domain-containing membrane protein YozV
MKTPIKLFPVLVVFLSLFLLGPFSLAHSAEKGVFLTDEVQLKMAEAFMEEGEYYRAITEYKKLLILFPDSEWADYTLFRMGIAYYNGEEYEPSVRSFSALRDKYPASSYIPKGYYFEGLGYWKLKRFKEARTAFDALSEDYPRSEHAPLALVAASLVSLEEENIPLSTDRLERLINRYPEHPSSTKANEAIPLIRQYQKLPEKSKTLATILSAIIPGSGYIYAGRLGDGITAFLINALWIAGVVTGIHAEYYAVSGIVAGVGLPFYFGNIYGSANAAKKWNLGIKRDFRNQVYLTLEFNF